jgi:hypothetical protein
MPLEETPQKQMSIEQTSQEQMSQEQMSIEQILVEETFYEISCRSKYIRSDLYLEMLSDTCC